MSHLPPLDCATKESNTPRVDALDYGDQSIFINGDGYGQLWELARQLERELRATTLRCQAADRTANAALADLFGRRRVLIDCRRYLDDEKNAFAKQLRLELDEILKR